MKTFVAFDSAPVLTEPDNGRLPVQAPLAEHEVASVDVHVNVALPPGVTDVGLASSVTCGPGTEADAATETVRAIAPPIPEHVSVNAFAAAERGPLDAEPAVLRVPLQAPLATHELAPVVDQVNVALAPLTTTAGSAFNVSVGAAAGSAVLTDFVSAPPPHPTSVATMQSVKTVCKEFTARSVAEQP